MALNMACKIYAYTKAYKPYPKKARLTPKNPKAIKYDMKSLIANCFILRLRCNKDCEIEMKLSIIKIHETNLKTFDSSGILKYKAIQKGYRLDNKSKDQ